MRTTLWEMRRLFYTYCNICKCSPLCTCVGSWGRHLFDIKLFSLFSQFNLFSLFSVRYFVQFKQLGRIFQHLTSFTSEPSASSCRFSISTLSFTNTFLPGCVHSWLDYLDRNYNLNFHHLITGENRMYHNSFVNNIICLWCDFTVMLTEKGYWW